MLENDNPQNMLVFYTSAKVSEMDGSISPLMDRKENLSSSSKYEFNNDLAYIICYIIFRYM